MRMLVFASRNRKEVMRDPLSLFFGIAFPLLLLSMFVLIFSKIPEAPIQFQAQNLTPAIAVFSFSFISLFTSLLVSRDRTSAFLLRVLSSPLRTWEYIVAYTLPVVPVALVQSAVCFSFSALLGFKLGVSTLVAMLVLLVISVLYVGFGLLIGTVFTDKQSGGIFSLFVNVTTWLSGTWFPINLIGGTFEKICYLLPFAHAVDAVRAACAGNYGEILPHLAWVAAWTVPVYAAATLAFKRVGRK